MTALESVQDQVGALLAQHAGRALHLHVTKQGALFEREGNKHALFHNSCEVVTLVRSETFLCRHSAPNQEVCGC